MTYEAASLVYNTPELVTSLRTQLPEIVIVDNGSHPALDANLTYLMPLSFTAAWNTYMQQSTADYVWMCNSDVEGISKEMLAALHHEMIKVNAFAITPSFNSPHLTFHRKLDKKRSSLRSTTWIDWCAPMVNREMFLELGGFDTDFIGYGADIDLCARARLQNYKMFISNRMNFHHINGYTIRRNPNSLQNDIRFMTKILKKKYGTASIELLTKRRQQLINKIQKTQQKK